MKSMMIGAAIAALIATPALSADLAVKAPTPLPPPVPILNWTGCYANAGAGYGMYNQDHTLQYEGVPYYSANQTAGGRGWLGLVGVGCDYQFSMGSWGNWVVGVFGDYDFMDLHGNFSEISDPFSLAGQEKENSAWAVGGRIGYLVTPAILAYWNGGFTSTRFGGVNGVSFAGTPSILSVGSQTFDGGFIGGGTEIAVQWWPGLFWRSEYRYSSYQSKDVQAFDEGIAYPTFVEHENKNVQTITSSLVWKFNWTGH
jgi:outer membrane immunogenic protein